MLEKSEYYHGAAIVRILEEKNCKSIHKLSNLGYIINNETFIFLKYRTKERTPWTFTFDQEDVDRCSNMAEQYKNVILGLICGGDGICGLNWKDGKDLLAGKPGHITTARKHNHSYSVWGTEGELKGKISANTWPALIFDSQELR